MRETSSSMHREDAILDFNRDTKENIALARTFHVMPIRYGCGRWLLDDAEHIESTHLSKM